MTVRRIGDIEARGDPVIIENFVLDTIMIILVIIIVIIVIEVIINE